VDVASRRELTNKRTVEHGRELFPALTLAGAVAIATIAGGAAAVVGTTVAVVCTLEDCMGCDSVRGWHDSDGSTFNCDWYAEGTNCLRCMGISIPTLVTPPARPAAPVVAATSKRYHHMVKNLCVWEKIIEKQERTMKQH
jgi:hypothetical protein